MNQHVVSETANRRLVTLHVPSLAEIDEGLPTASPRFTLLLWADLRSVSGSDLAQLADSLRRQGIAHLYVAGPDARRAAAGLAASLNRPGGTPTPVLPLELPWEDSLWHALHAAVPDGTAQTGCRDTIVLVVNDEERYAAAARLLGDSVALTRRLT